MQNATFSQLFIFIKLLYNGYSSFETIRFVPIAGSGA